MLAQQGSESAELRGVQERGCAAAEVKLFNWSGMINVGDSERDFAFEVGQIMVGGFASTGDDVVAPAIPTEGLAKRQVDVERKRTLGGGDRTRGVVGFDGGDGGGGIEFSGKLCGGGIGGVTWSGDCVFAY